MASNATPTTPDPDNSFAITAGDGNVVVVTLPCGLDTKMIEQLQALKSLDWVNWLTARVTGRRTLELQPRARELSFDAMEASLTLVLGGIFGIVRSQQTGFGTQTLSDADDTHIRLVLSNAPKGFMSLVVAALQARVERKWFVSVTQESDTSVLIEGSLKRVRMLTIVTIRSVKHQWSVRDT